MNYRVKAKYFLFALFCIFQLQISYALESDTSQLNTFIEKISTQSKQQLYDVDTDELANQLLPLLKRNLFIKTVEIIESNDNQVVLRFYRKDKVIYFNTAIPSNFDVYPTERVKIYHEDKVVGTVVIQYKINNLFTAEERQWINSHVVKVGIEDIPPLLFEKANNPYDMIKLSAEEIRWIVPV